MGKTKRTLGTVTVDNKMSVMSGTSIIAECYGIPSNIPAKECEANASFIAESFNSANILEVMLFDGEATVKALPEVMKFLQAKYFDHHAECKMCQRGLCKIGVGYERLLEKCRGN